MRRSRTFGRSRWLGLRRRRRSHRGCAGCLAPQIWRGWFGQRRLGSAAPLVVEWRRLREEYRTASAGLAKLRAEEDSLEMEMLLVGGCGLTLPPADYPWDRFDLEDQTRRRRRRLAVVQEEIRRAELQRRLRRVFTLGQWRS